MKIIQIFSIENFSKHGKELVIRCCFTLRKKPFFFSGNMTANNVIFFLLNDETGKRIESFKNSTTIK